jgi:hypothetical protein
MKEAIVMKSLVLVTVGTRIKDIKTMVSFIQQSLELRIYPNGFFY